jgi:hypothetical protein
MSRNIDRIEAQKDVRTMSVAIASQSSAENITTFRQSLIVEAGTIVKLEGAAKHSPLDAKRDESGFASLKAMATQKIGQ